MTSKKRFLLGGLGALLPVLVTVIAIDVNSIGDFTTGNVIGFSLRYLALFLIGGFVAYLHSDEEKPYKIVEFGITAPAIITSMITANGVGAYHPANNPETSLQFSLATPMYADDNLYHKREITYVAGFEMSDIIDGITGKAYKRVNTPKTDNSVNTTSKTDSNTTIEQP